MSGGIYDWMRGLHVIFVIAWMAGLLYLPRLFVYHCGAPAGSNRSEMLKTMERRLLRAIMTPAMILSFTFGGAILSMSEFVYWDQGWIYVKLVLVVGLAVIHGALARWRREFAADGNRHGEKFFRVVNEIPTLLMIGIILLAVVKPF